MNRKDKKEERGHAHTLTLVFQKCRDAKNNLQKHTQFTLKNNVQKTFPPTRPKFSAGFIEIIAVIIIAVLVISYFGFDLAGLLEDSQTMDNIDAVFTFIADLWNNYFEQPAAWVWNNVVVGFLWEDVIKTLLNK